MATKYSLSVTSKAIQPGVFCVYTTCPDPKVVQLNLQSLAWFTKAANPKTILTFEWDLDYSFVWCQTGKLNPGVRFRASQDFPANPQKPALSKVFLDVANGAYQFTENAPADKQPPAGTLGIYTGGNIPSYDVSAGIALGGSPALVTSVGPNLGYTFIPKIKYWIAFGSFVEGEVLDLNAMTVVQEIDFPTNVYDIGVTLNEDNTWTVGKTSLLRAQNDLIRSQIK
ncbi:MAG: hypothetical protein LBJ35_04055 [Spirochaetaceae bacterium]|nr:hypothetical protein [Spirochaetaceae bacterium]